MQGDITITNIYIPKDGPSKYMKHKLTELKGERQFLNNIWTLQTPLTMERTRSKSGNRELKLRDKPDLRHIHSPPPNSRYILLKCTQDIFQERSHVRQQIKSQWILKDGYHTKYPLLPQQDEAGSQ